MKDFTNDELLQREKRVLERMSKLLSKAAFYELPESLVRKTITEDKKYEKLHVDIDFEAFKVLRLWVIGLDLAPVNDLSLYNKANYYSKRKSKHMDPNYHMYHDGYFVKGIKFEKVKDKLSNTKKSFPRIERYKRVIVAFRKKKNSKLYLKAFKDIPCDNLEFLLPEGVLRMKNSDRIWLASLSGLLMLFYGVGIMNSFKVQTNLVIFTTLLVILFRSWNMTKNLKRKYIMNVSKTLYFKTLANNHALLTLISDRCEDEVFKAISLVCTFMWLKDFEESSTSDELNLVIRTWFKENYRISLQFDSISTLRLLEKLNIVQVSNSNYGKQYKLNFYDIYCQNFGINVDTSVEDDSLLAPIGYIHGAEKYDWES